MSFSSMGEDAILGNNDSLQPVGKNLTHSFLIVRT